MRSITVRTAVAALAATSLLALAGCATGGESPTPSASAGSALSELAEVDTLANAVPEDIRTRGTLEIAVAGTAAPLGVIDTNGNITGITPDLARAIGTVLGLEVNVSAPAFADAIVAVDGGKYDALISGASITQAREQTYDLTSFLSIDYTILAKAGNAAGDAAEVTDLCGLKIADTSGDSAGDYVKNVIDPQCTAAGKDPVQLDIISSSANVDLAVQSGQDDARLNTSIAAVWRAAQSPDQWTAAGVRFFAGPDGIVTKKDGAFTQVIADTINYLITQGSYGEILANWSSAEAGVAKAEVNPAVDN